MPKRKTRDPGSAGTAGGEGAPPASEPASGGAPPASGGGASHSTVIVLVLATVLQAAPAGTGPSAVANVIGTGPATVQVKLALAAFGWSNVPLGADHAYESALGTGPAAIAATWMVPPTAVSAGTADTLVTSAQLKVVPLTSVTCDPVVTTLQASATGTGVVTCDWMANDAEPVQVTLPSIAVPDNVMR